MARKPKEEGFMPLKEETLNLVITAQKEKITALTEYGKKLKAQLKESKEDHVVTCDDIEESYKQELLNQENIHQKLLVLAVIAALLFGLFIGMVI
jgi:mRNA degradation ribonuclease J1/J2